MPVARQRSNKYKLSFSLVRLDQVQQYKYIFVLPIMLNVTVCCVETSVLSSIIRVRSNSYSIMSCSVLTRKSYHRQYQVRNPMLRLPLYLYH